MVTMNYKKLMDLTQTFASLEPWRYISDEKIFIIQHPETKENYFCSILGNSDVEYGLNAFIGNKGFINIINLFGDGPVYDFIPRTHMLTLNFDEAEFLSDEDIKIIEENDFEFIEGLGYCQFSSKKAGFVFEMFDEEEIKAFEIILEQSIAMVKKFKNKPKKLVNRDFDKFYGRVYNNGHWMTQVIVPELQFKPLDVNRFVIMSLTNKFKKIYDQWEIGFYYMDHILEEPNQKPFFPGIILIAETDTGQIIGEKVYNPNHKNLLSEIKELIIDTIKEIEVIPTMMVFDDLEVLGGLKKFLAYLDINFEYDPYPLVLDELKMALVEETLLDEVNEFKEEIKKKGLSVEDIFDEIAADEAVDEEFLEAIKNIFKD